MSRKSARVAAFKTIFEIPFHDVEAPADIISYSADCGTLTSENDKEYYKAVTTKCFENIVEIDNQISKALKGWTMNRISKINLAILRLAICEINYFEDIPYQVSINEAVEITKTFSDDESPAFINGILSSVL